MTTPDPQLDRVRRAFNSAFQRVCAATTPTDAENEFGIMLDWFYRLNELGKRRLGDMTFTSGSSAPTTSGLPGPRSGRGPSTSTIL